MSFEEVFWGGLITLFGFFTIELDPHFPTQPSPRITPMSPCSYGGYSQRFGHFFVGHSDEESKLHDLGLFGRFQLQPRNGFVQGQQLVRWKSVRQFDLVERDALPLSSPFEPPFAPGLLD